MSSASNQSVLLVDNSETSLKVIERLIKKNIPNIEVTTCTKAKCALQLLDMRTFDLLCTGMNLTDMTGQELTGIIRDELKMHSLPIIMISGNAPSILQSNPQQTMCQWLHG